MSVCLFQSEQSCIELGAQVVGTVSYQHLTIGNDSSCDVQYRLLVQQFVSGPYGEDDQQLQNDQNIGTDLVSSFHAAAPATSCSIKHGRTFVIITLEKCIRFSEFCTCNKLEENFTHT